MEQRRNKMMLKFKPGEIIFEEDAPGNKIFIIHHGEVEITRKADEDVITLAHLKRGSVFGEMALVDAGPRSATARAITHVQCLSISQTLLRHKMEKEVPVWMQSIFSMVVDRLRLTNMRATVEAHPIPSPQIVGLLAMFLRRGDTNNSGQSIVPWDQALRKIVFFLDLPQKYVERVMNILAESEIAGYEITHGTGRNFLVPSMDNFEQFAEYSRDSMAEDRRKEPTEAELKKKAKEPAFIKRLLLLAEAETKLDFLVMGHEDIINALKKMGTQSRSEFEAYMKKYLEQGLVEEHDTQSILPVYRINVDLMRQHLTAFDMEDVFDEVLERISISRSVQPNEGAMLP